MEERTSIPQPLRRRMTVGAVLLVLGIASVVLGLVATLGSQSWLGPALIVAGALIGVVGGAVRFDAHRQATDHYAGDPRFRRDQRRPGRS